MISSQGTGTIQPTIREVNRYREERAILYNRIQRTGDYRGCTCSIRLVTICRRDTPSPACLISLKRISLISLKRIRVKRIRQIRQIRIRRIRQIRIRRIRVEGEWRGSGGDRDGHTVTVGSGGRYGKVLTKYVWTFHRQLC